MNVQIVQAVQTVPIVPGRGEIPAACSSPPAGHRFRHLSDRSQDRRRSGKIAECYEIAIRILKEGLPASLHPQLEDYRSLRFVSVIIFQSRGENRESSSSMYV